MSNQIIAETINELREMKNDSICRRYTLNKAIIACEQLRRMKKEAKWWKRKYSEMRSMVEKSAEVLDYSDRNGLHLSYPAWIIAHRLGKALEPYLLEKAERRAE